MKLNKTLKMRQIVESYGDLVFDLCESVLESPALAQLVFQKIVKKIGSEISATGYSTYERSWVLKIATTELTSLLQMRPDLIEAKRQIEIDSRPGDRIQVLDFYFRRLRPELQFLLLLKEKHGLPLVEISAALSTPIDTLKLQREQALKTLEEWVWTNS